MQEHLSLAATRLAEAWQHDRHLSNLELALQPKNRGEAYAVQALLVEQINEPIFGWKIAATSEGGQRHINVGAPLAGRLFASRVLPDGATLSLIGNRMLVAEAEFGFRFGKAIPARANHGHDDAISMENMLEAVTDMVLAIELPDSRFEFSSRRSPINCRFCLCTSLYPRADGECGLAITRPQQTSGEVSCE